MRGIAEYEAYVSVILWFEVAVVSGMRESSRSTTASRLCSHLMSTLSAAHIAESGNPLLSLDARHPEMLFAKWRVQADAPDHHSVYLAFNFKPSLQSLARS